MTDAWNPIRSRKAKRRGGARSAARIIPAADVVLAGEVVVRLREMSAPRAAGGQAGGLRVKEAA